jgi:benzylsuccinate CoA-transferase BbsF subunit
MATQLLGDMGAEVIKVESRHRLDGLRFGRPVIGDDVSGGDEGKWPDMQPAFHALNRNKLGITVNMKHSKGLSLIQKLVRVSDVVADNFSPGVMARNGLDYESLRKIKPDIIAISLSGLGQYGPMSNATVYAGSIISLAGISSMIGYYGEPPLGMTAMAYGNSNASVHAAFAILAALYYRERTGEGQYIDLSEVEASVSILGEAIMEYSMNGRVLGPQGNRHSIMAPHNNYRCKGEDRWVSIAIKSDEEWQHFCQAIGNPEWTKEARFDDGLSRWKNQGDLDKLVTNWTSCYTPYEVMDMLQEVGVAAVPVMNVEDQYFDPHFKERQTYIEIEHPLVGLEVLYGIPWRLSETPGQIRRVAPSLGEHNGYVFGELLGLSTKEIAQLVEEKIIY